MSSHIIKNNDIDVDNVINNTNNNDTNNNGEANENYSIGDMVDPYEIVFETPNIITDNKYKDNNTKSLLDNNSSFYADIFLTLILFILSILSILYSLFLRLKFNSRNILLKFNIRNILFQSVILIALFIYIITILW